MNETTADQEPKRNTSFLINFAPIVMLLVGLAVAGILVMFTQTLHDLTFNFRLTEDEIFLIAFSMIVILILTVFIVIRWKRKKEESKDDLKDVLNQMSQKKENKGEITW